MASTALVTSHPQSVRKVFSKYMNLKGRVERLNEKAEEVMEGVVRTTETVGSSFLFGGLQGSFYGRKDATGKVINDEFFGVSLPLGAGILMHTAAILGFGGRYSGHLRNFGDGALCAYVSNMGRGVGYRWKQKQAATTKTSGSLTDDIAAMLSS